LRSFRDRDYLTTPEGFIFTVVGNLHPADRIIAYLKYVPDEHGKWGLGRSRYRRAIATYNVPSVVASMEFLRGEAPQYIFESSVDSISLPAVPIDRVVSHLCPETRLLELQNSESRDELEKKALRFAELVSERAGVPISSLGLTGSILARIHNPTFSDIDLVVYGFNNAPRVRDFLRRLKDSSLDEIRKLSGATKEKWIGERLKSTPLTRQDIMTVFARKWNIGSFDGTEFSVHAVHTESEVRGHYGDERYASLGIIDATAEIVGDKESMFMPAVFQIEHAHMKDTQAAYLPDRVVSYEGLYADVVGEGETVLCRGKLERVTSSSGIAYRILIGSAEAAGTDYLLPVRTDRP
jgi:predicted nucleotidyltransferase